MRSKNKK